MSGITDFIARWEVSGASERANYQLFLSELAEVLGFEKPHPATGTPDLDTYTFERPVTFNNPNGSTSTGFIDLYKRGCFMLEAKQGSEKNKPADPQQLTLLPDDEARNTRRGTAVRGTKGWDDAMLKARGQAYNYARSLPIAEGWPPFLIVADVGHVIASAMTP
jgi:hypothetical protein